MNSRTAICSSYCHPFVNDTGCVARRTLPFIVMREKQSHLARKQAVARSVTWLHWQLWRVIGGNHNTMLAADLHVPSCRCPVDDPVQLGSIHHPSGVINF
jgi:hypothetical protein